MAVWRNHELEELVGGSLDATGITEASAARLTMEDARESEVLEFKAKLWGSADRQNPKPGQELAKDVGSFANLRGGLILVGIEEGPSGVAAQLRPLGATLDRDREERRLKQTLAVHMTPHAETQFVWIPVAAGGWLCAVIVPPSRHAPHAVLVDREGGLRYPVRYGSAVRWLSEHEVADRYRRRHAGAADVARRVDEISQQGSRTLRGAGGLWLHASAVPETPSGSKLDKETVDRIDGWHRTTTMLSPLGRHISAYGRGIPAPGRVTFTGARRTDQQDETEVRDAYVELHVDGAALAATPIAERTDDDGAGRDVGEITLVDDSILLIDLVLRWAREQAGAWGTATVTLGIAGSLDVKGPIRLVTSTGSRLAQLEGTRELFEDFLTQTVADLAAVDTVQQRLSVAHAALSAVLQHFGLAEPSQLARDGTIVPGQFGMSKYRAVERWALDRGVQAERLREV